MNCDHISIDTLFRIYNEFFSLASEIINAFTPCETRVKSRERTDTTLTRCNHTGCLLSLCNQFQ